MSINIKNMSLKEFSINFLSFTKEELINEILNNNIEEYDIEVLKAFFLRVDYDLKKLIIDNEKCYGDLILLQIMEEKLFRILYNSDPKIFNYLVNSKYATNYFMVFEKFVSSLDKNQLQKFLYEIDIDKLYETSGYKNDSNSVIHFLEDKYGVLNNDIKERITSVINNKMISPLCFYRLENKNELYVLAYFNVIVECSDEYSDIVLNNGTVIPLNLLNKTKPSHIIKLMKDLGIKSKFDSEIFFEVAIKLNTLFGFDIAKKIITDKFSYLNENSIKRIVNFKFINIRREYRFNNQQKFYFYGMISEIENAINTQNHEFLINLIDDDNYDVNKFIEDYNKINDEESKIAYIKRIIEERETRHKEKLDKVLNIKLNKKIEKFKTVNGISAKQLLRHLKELDLNVVSSYTDEEKTKLIDLLVGNEKKDNDCILRLIFNDEALGLELSTIANKFRMIEKVAKKSKLSYNKILNLVEILKINLFNIPADCKDINLNTLVKIISSKSFIVNSDKDILSETLKLHRERKLKTLSSIPSVSGKLDSIKYYIAPFDSESLLSLGVDSASCMKINGLGEEFFKHCLLSKDAGVLIIELSDVEKVYCPIIRTGNGVHINSIEPKIEKEQLLVVINILEKAFEDIMSLSSEDEKIEVCTVGDLHYEGKIKNKKVYNKEEEFPYTEKEDKTFIYSDFNKENITHYIISENNYTENKYYIPKIRYYQNRVSPYEYNVNDEYDPDRLNMIINMIAFSSLDYKKIDSKERNSKKRNYKYIDVNSFLYIIGNKDWYIAIDESYNVVADILPYDKRAIDEYLKQLSKIGYKVLELSGGLQR